jgi:hypothetical protein
MHKRCVPLFRDKMTTDKETKFIDSIDCRFPYQDKVECLRLIDEATEVSVNAIFSVTEEICRIPVSEKDKVEIGYLLDLLTYTRDKFDHPIKEIVFDTADKMIRGQELTVDEAIGRMETVKKYRGQFAAMSILYFSCDDIDGRLEPLWNNIMTEWKK